MGAGVVGAGVEGGVEVVGTGVEVDEVEEGGVEGSF